MSDITWSQSVALELEASSDILAADDDRWVDTVERFQRELEERLGRDVVQRETRPVEGMKGGLAAIILSLGSAGAFTAATAALHDWLARSGDRSLTIKVGGQVVKVSGKNVKDETLLESLRVAVKGG
jgi:hypothetical protein